MAVLTGQDKMNTRRLIWGLIAVLAIALVAFVGVNTHKARSAARWRGLPSCTWNGVPAMLNAAVQSEQYKQSGKYLSNPQVMINDERKATAYAHRVVVDFLCSLSPEQVKIIRRTPLALNHLTRDQKDLLLLLAVLPDKEGLRKLTDESAVFISAFPAKFEQGTFLFTWTMPPDPQRRGWTGFWMSLTTDGETGFFQGLKPIKKKTHQRRDFQ